MTRKVLCFRLSECRIDHEQFLLLDHFPVLEKSSGRGRNVTGILIEAGNFSYPAEYNVVSFEGNDSTGLVHDLIF